MKDIETRKKSYLSLLLLSVRNLMSAGKRMPYRDIRPSFLCYTLCFPLAMIFINAQNRIMPGEISVFHFTAATLQYLSFSAGAVLLFVFTNKKNIIRISRTAAVLTASAFIVWIIVRDGYPSLICALFLMAGIGGCVAESSFSFVFLLNRTERFLSCSLMVLLTMFLKWPPILLHSGEILKKFIAAVLVFTVAICLYVSKEADFASRHISGPVKPDALKPDTLKPDTLKPDTQKPDTQKPGFLKTDSLKTASLDPEPSYRQAKSMYLALYIFVSYFSVRIIGFYSPAFDNPENRAAWGGAAILAIFCFIVLEFLLQKSTWILTCIFYISTVLGCVMWYSGYQGLAYFFSEVKELGFLLTFYLIGCASNLFCSFRFHKILVILCIALTAVLYIGIDILHTAGIDTQMLTCFTAASFFIIFLFLSPVFSRYLFFADWYRQTQEKPENEGTGQLQDLSVLTPREKQVVLLLLQGMTLRQTAAELGLTLSTVSTYSKTIYKKLGINSRSELFIRFSRNASGTSKD